MTKRIKAAYHHYALLEKQLSAHHIPDGPHVAAFLKRFPPFQPILLAAHDVRCKACDVMNQVGDTVFVTTDHPHPGPVLCYRCGIAWEITNNRLTVEAAVAIPAIGGPST